MYVSACLDSKNPIMPQHSTLPRTTSTTTCKFRVLGVHVQHPLHALKIVKLSTLLATNYFLECLSLFSYLLRFKESSRSEDSVIPTMTPMMMPSGVIIPLICFGVLGNQCLCFPERIFANVKNKRNFYGGTTHSEACGLV